MASYILLATQVKFDVTGIAVSPKSWYTITLPELDCNKEEAEIWNALVKSNNDIVEELRLSKDFFIYE